MTDAELLKQHRQGNRAAFAELVRRHAGWVYSAACRRMRDEHLAEDVTQAVFEVLARKSPKMGANQTLSLWLHGVVTLTCKQALRTEFRRRRRETEAAKMRSDILNPDQREWKDLAPHIDELVGRLNRADRQAVLLRFFEQKSFAEVGAAIGVTEEAARKRVSRATERLRGMLAVKGLSMPAISFGAMLLAEVTRPAPAALAGKLAAISVGAAGTLAKGVVVMMAISKAKLATIMAVVALLVMGGGVYVATQSFDHQKALPIVSENPTSAPAQAPPTTAESRQAEFERVYSLADGEVLKNIEPPFVEGRIDFVRAPAIARGMARPDSIPETAVWMRWDGQLHLWGNTVAAKPNLDSVMRYPIGLEPYDYQLPPEVLAMEMPGDWVYRADATTSQKLEALSQLVFVKKGKTLRFISQPTDQEVIVVTGKYEFKRLEQADDANVHVFVDKLDRSEGIVRSDPLDRFFTNLAERLRMRFVNQTEGDPPFRVKSVNHDSAAFAIMDAPGPDREAKLNRMFDALSAQTGLKFTHAIQTYDIWMAAEGP